VGQPWTRSCHCITGGTSAGTDSAAATCSCAVLDRTAAVLCRPPVHHGSHGRRGRPSAGPHVLLVDILSGGTAGTTTAHSAAGRTETCAKPRGYCDRHWSHLLPMQTESPALTFARSHCQCCGRGPAAETERCCAALAALTGLEDLGLTFGGDSSAGHSDGAAAARTVRSADCSA
jgi:hypothetical protein